MPRKAISTGSLRLDIILRMGGIPRGEFIEISGNVSSGKTTLCQHIVAEAQKTGEPCAWIDVDHSLNADYLSSCGVKPQLLYVSEPETAEQAFGILEILARSGSMSIIVLDSVTSLISESELKPPINGSPPYHSIDSQLSQTLRKLHPVIHKNGTAILLTDQVRKGISRVYHDLAQNPSRLALKLHPSVHLELHSLRSLRKNGLNIGNRIVARVIKNNFAPCLHRTGFDIIYKTGIDKAGEIFDLGIQLRIICKQKKDFYFRDQVLGVSSREALQFLKQNRTIAEEIEKIIRLKMIPDIYPAAT